MLKERSDFLLVLFKMNLSKSTIDAINQISIAIQTYGFPTKNSNTRVISHHKNSLKSYSLPMIRNAKTTEAKKIIAGFETNSRNNRKRNTFPNKKENWFRNDNIRFAHPEFSSLSIINVTISHSYINFCITYAEFWISLFASFRLAW